MDRKKVIINEDTIRQNLRLDDANGIDCLPNEEIFDELARMGYEKPSIKLTFYKAFFSAQYKFFIHTIVQCMSTKRTAWNEFSSSMAPVVICLATGSKFNFSKYIFDSLADVAEVEEDEDNQVSAVPTPPLPTPATTPPPPQQESIPSPLQAQSAQPSSPPQQHPSQTAALEITMLKQRVRKLEKKRKVKSSGLKRLKKVGTAQKVESSIDTIVDDQEDASKQGLKIAKLDANKDVTLVDVDAKVKMDASIHGRRIVESQAKAYNLDLQHSEKVLSMQDTDEAEPTELEEVLEVVTTAKLMTEVVTTAAQISKTSAPRRRRGVVIQDPDETAASLVIVHSEVKPKDKGKGILIEEPKPLKGQAQIDMDEAFARQLEAE
nr:glutamic acid-rich protein-like [Tanacetum cinerariifolium]